MLKSISEIRNWAHLSDGEKRYKIFRESYNMSLFIDKYTQDKSNVVFVSKNLMPYYFGRYSLYPKRLYRADNITKLKALLSTKKINYIVTYNMNIKIEDYNPIATFSSKNTSDIGILYKSK